jgi:hypothetical protein
VRVGGGERDGGGEGVDACCAVGCVYCVRSIVSLFWTAPCMQRCDWDWEEGRTGEFVNDGLADGVCCVCYDAYESILKHHKSAQNFEPAFPSLSLDLHPTYQFPIRPIRRKMLALQLLLAFIRRHFVVCRRLLEPISGWSQTNFVAGHDCFYCFRPDNSESHIMSVYISTGRGDAIGIVWLELSLSGGR